MVSKKMKYASMASIGLMTMSLVACANEQSMTPLGDPVQTQQNMKNNGIQTIEQSKLADKCKEYELQPDGSYKCDDDGYSGGNGGGGGGGGFWFFNGHTYGSHNAMVNSSDYQKNNLVSGTKFNSKTDGRTNKNSKSNKNGGSNNPKSNGSKSSSGGKTGGFGGGARGGSSGGS